VCRNFLSGAQAALEAVPGEIVSFFFTRDEAVNAANTAGSSWLRSKAEVYGQALCMPVSIAADFLDWEVRNVAPRLLHDDMRVTIYAHARKRFIWYTVPSLVQHRAGESTIGHTHLLSASVWLGPEGDALAIDWSKGVFRPPLDKNRGGVSDEFRRFTREYKWLDLSGPDYVDA
jgi:hypothetical protein